jgi:uncharacterized membrane protein YkoI
MEQSTRRGYARGFACAAMMTVALGMTGCAHWGSQEDLPVTEISRLQSSGAVLPFNRLNAAVVARHPGSTVEHAALDKMGERYLYQASLSDPNKMQWFVELDAKTGETVTDQQDAH